MAQQRSQGSAAPVPVGKESSIAKAAGMEVDQVHQFVTTFGGKPYINKDGRRFKMDQRFGAGHYQVEVAPPSDEEYAFLCKMMGVKKDDPCIIMKARVYVDGKKMSEDYGFVTPSSTPAGPAQFNKDGLHIAITKATNRAMGMLIAGGFADPEVSYDGGAVGVDEEAEPSVHVNPSTGHEGYVPATGSAQVSFLNECKKLKKQIVTTFGSDEQYYEVLHSMGYDKSNDPKLCANAEAMDFCISALSEVAYPSSLSVSRAEQQDPAPVHPDPEPPYQPGYLEDTQYWMDVLGQCEEGDVVEIVDDIMHHVCGHDAMQDVPPQDLKGRTYAMLLSAHVNKVKEKSPIDRENIISSLNRAFSIIKGYEASQAAFG
jgi:hypothetical protein